MTVIPFPQRPPPRLNPTLPQTRRSVPVRGTFRAPSGRCGTMTGSLRLEHVRVGSDELWVAGVFTGEMFDADGERIGACSRRQSAPAHLGDSGEALVTVGPVDVDLMGLVVTVSTVRVPSAPATGDHKRGHAARRHTALRHPPAEDQGRPKTAPDITPWHRATSHAELSEETS